MKLIFTLFMTIIGVSLNAQCEYFETFETYSNSQVPDDWTVINTTNYNYVTAQVQTNTSAPSPSKYFRLSNGQGSTGDLIVILPMNANTSDGNHRISFYLSGSTASASSLQVGTIDATDGSGTFQLITAISDYPTSPSQWKKYYISIPSGSNQYIAFRHSLEDTHDSFGIDDICFQEIPSCMEVSDIATTEVESNTITFGWTASDSAESLWEYIVQTTDLPAPTASTSGTETSTNTVTVNNLEADTDYNIYVRAKCSSDDFGSWEGPTLVTTACSDYTANFFSGFEDNVNAEEVKPCWSTYDTGNGDLKTFGVSFGIVPSEGSLQLRLLFLNSTPNNSLALISPEFSDLSSDKQIRFKMNKRANTEANMKIEVGTVTSPTDMDSFVLLDDTTLTESTVVASTWTEFTISLSSYDDALGHKYIVFKPQHNGTGATQYIFMDEFNYEYNLDVVLNDEPVTADPIMASPDYNCENSISGTFEGATQSEEFPCDIPTYSEFVDLWYKIVPTETGRYSFSLNIPSTATGNLFIWHEVNGELNQLTSGCLTRFVARDLVAGETYYISIGSAETTTPFELCIQLFPESENDEPADAILLTESTTDECENAIEGNTALATHSNDSECSTGQIDVWYTFTPTQTAEYTLRRSIISGTAPTYISVYSGTPDNLTIITDCNSQLTLVNLTAGETYYVAVSTSPLSEPVYFSLCAYPSPPAPENDACDTPVELTVGSTFEENVIIGDNTSATVDLVNTPFPTCGTLDFDTRGRDVWFTVTVPPSGNFVIETRSVDGSLIYDTVMETYTGTCGIDSLEPYYYKLPPPNENYDYCNDQFVIGGNQFAGARFEDKIPGEQVLIRVWGWSLQFGEFQISVYDDTETCENPTNITISEITNTTATLSWNAPTNEPVGGYEYIVQPIETGYPGEAEGVQTSETSVEVSGLDKATEYEVYVRSICSTNDSAWEGPTTFETTDLGLNDFDINAINIYPNPVKDLLNISTKSEINEILIFDLTGNLITKQEIHSKQGKVNVSNLNSGVYILKIITDTTVKSVKIIKK
ncbi:MAG: fibronectin type III domain-containing protein [Moheibacter sp.]